MILNIYYVENNSIILFLSDCRDLISSLYNTENPLVTQKFCLRQKVNKLISVNRNAVIKASLFLIHPRLPTSYLCLRYNRLVTLIRISPDAPDAIA